MVYDNEFTMVLVYFLIPARPEMPYRSKCLVASSAALVHAVHPQHQKTYLWKNGAEDTSCAENQLATDQAGWNRTPRKKASSRARRSPSGAAGSIPKSGPT